ncbi:adhesion G protein-coupled receptor E3-like [Eupeodes corollae]|uniref:adhesion G protein-coupled receptor E3-like n=1 Tax=Eupeodes corollae TaxID=290404 RepID=UPI0024901BC0|nr:adhesion G protein-coupled receptor E3-like [Eupeodes corollae]XP_055913600.1 adhesion G protein-coupled receptor E3-like [Eupeodes corollae]
METFYSHHLRTFIPAVNSSSVTFGSEWGSQGSVITLGVVLGSSISLVGLAFAFITYSLFSDLRSLAGTALLSLLATLFMAQLLFVIGVGGIQDPELCVSLSLAFLFMKLASLCWMICCCHQALRTFRHSVNLIFRPEPKMCKLLTEYNCFSWGFPLLMVAIAAAFKYNETSSVRPWLKKTIDNRASRDEFIARHCWIMEGQAYIWAYMVPAIFILFIGFHLAYQAKHTAKISAQMQVDVKTRRKLIKRRLLQCGLFIKILTLFTIVNIFGSLAALMEVVELWAVYCIAQGVQGIVTALLVTCNCRVLKLYTSSRGTKFQQGMYNNLRDGEGGRYGVLTVTNPNYREDGVLQAAPDEPPAIGNQRGAETEEDIDGSGDDTFVYARYEEESFVGRQMSRKTILRSGNVNSELTDSLPTNAIQLTPLPQTV